MHGSYLPDAIVGCNGFCPLNARPWWKLIVIFHLASSTSHPGIGIFGKYSIRNVHPVLDAFLCVFLKIKIFEHLNVTKIRSVRHGILDFLESEMAVKGQNGPTRPENISDR